MKKGIALFMIAATLWTAGCAKKAELYEGTSVPTFSDFSSIESTLRLGDTFTYYRHACTEDQKKELAADYIRFLTEHGFSKLDRSTDELIFLKNESDGICIDLAADGYIDVLPISLDIINTQYYPDTTVPMLENTCNLKYGDVSNINMTMYIYNCDDAEKGEIIQNYIDYLKKDFGLAITEEAQDMYILGDSEISVGIIASYPDQIAVFPTQLTA